MAPGPLPAVADRSRSTERRPRAVNGRDADGFWLFILSFSNNTGVTADAAHNVALRDANGTRVYDGVIEGLTDVLPGESIMIEFISGWDGAATSCDIVALEWV